MLFPHRLATMLEPTTFSTVSVRTENLGTMESPRVIRTDSCAPDVRATVPPAPATAPDATNAVRTSVVRSNAFTSWPLRTMPFPAEPEFLPAEVSDLWSSSST